MKPLAACLLFVLSVALFDFLASAAEPSPPLTLITGETATLAAPHGRGNVYAPEIARRAGALWMWFGGQGKDGHDRIHLSTSHDGERWEHKGVVLEDATANHCNDPSVVEANGVLYMYYSRAGSGVADEISVATSVDGIKWQPRGTALARGGAGSWDSFAVGRPSVLVEDGIFRMWYDGRKDLPPGAPDATAPKSPTSQRHVGYAVSSDGLHWRRESAAPVYDHDAGGIHVCRLGRQLVMLSESHTGTDCAVSRDGINWRPLGRLVARADVPREQHGHVTPFLLPDPDHSGATLYYGAAAAPTWDANAITARRLTAAQWQMLRSVE